MRWILWLGMLVAVGCGEGDTPVGGWRAGSSLYACFAPDGRAAIGDTPAAAVMYDGTWSEDGTLVVPEAAVGQPGHWSFDGERLKIAISIGPPESYIIPFDRDATLTCE